VARADAPTLRAIADLHVEAPENREFVDDLRPDHDGDWLIVCGDVADHARDIVACLRSLAERYAKVLWVPGNHDLWTLPTDPVQLRGEERYRHLVDECRELGVATPEDPYPTWDGPGGPATVAPLFTFYDYSFGRAIAPTKEQALERARDAGIVCSDEIVLHPDPHATREDWCGERVDATAERLVAAHNGGAPTVLISHWPLLREPTKKLMFPEFAQWCGTERTADWHTRFDAVAVVYGHLHIPRTTHYDGVRFEEVSLGYPREWRRRRREPALRRILPPPEEPAP
jgi:3',5'-cyclic AMP phosphodiesterase CpdA